MQQIIYSFQKKFTVFKLANISDALFDKTSPVNHEAWFPEGDNNIQHTTDGHCNL